MITSVAVEIAGIVIEITSDLPLDEDWVSRQFRGFLTDKPADCHLNVHYGIEPPVCLGNAKLLFDSGGVWKLYGVGNQQVITLGVHEESGLPHLTGVFSSDFSQGNLYLTKLAYSPIPHPLPELLTVLLLAQGRGVMMHACGVDDHGRGYLFSGSSGSGKSTLARLWTESGQGAVLNDDRIILRVEDGAVWMYGTPWHGLFPEFRPERVQLERIFFLYHAPKNVVNAVDGSAAVAGLLTRCFPVIWNTAATVYTIDFMTALARKVPCSSLHFVPDSDVIDLVRCTR
ncbi:MAG: hypothetical protein IAE80_07830 [Anaerolinea sp.]|nr:hypothetical protein [Anaerolinea sp.]